MLTRTPDWRQLIAPLLFAMVIVGVAIAIFRAFGGSVPLQAQGYRVSARVPEADAVLANSDVRISGVDVGHVTDVESRGRFARVTMEIDPRFAPLRAGARLVVRSKTLLGEGYVEIAPGPVTATAIPDGGALAVKQVQKAQRLDDVLQTFSPETRKDLRLMIQGTATAFAGRAGDLNDAIGSAPRAVTNLTQVLDNLDEQAAPLQQLVAQSTDVFEAIGSREADIAGTIRQGTRLASVTADRNRQLSATLDALPPFLERLKSATGTLGDASGDLSSAAASLRPTAPLLRPALETLRDRTVDTESLFRRVPALFRDVKTALPPTTKILDETAKTLPTTHLAMRELLPFMQLAAASKKQFVSNFANVAAMFNGRYQVAGGQMGQYASASLTAWNEIVGGWTKKLPTNRPNPYPKPGATDKMAQGGLEAYDCRHLGNTLFLPALGSGVPDCKTQGPWTLNGKTAYYPRLELPAP